MLPTGSVAPPSYNFAEAPLGPNERDPVNTDAIIPVHSKELVPLPHLGLCQSLRWHRVPYTRARVLYGLSRPFCLKIVLNLPDSAGGMLCFGTRLTLDSYRKFRFFNPG